MLLDQGHVPFRPNDYLHRPVVVRYASRSAADAAVRGHDRRTYARREATVLWIPPNLPSSVSAAYRFAGSAGLQ